MTVYNAQCKTWQDVLIEKGFDSHVSKSLIGFISWNRGEEFTKLGTELTEILSGYEGRIFVKDVVSTDYNDKGLLIFSTDVPEYIVNEMFNAIMDYEQNDVYDSLY